MAFRVTLGLLLGFMGIALLMNSLTFGAIGSSLPSHAIAALLGALLVFTGTLIARRFRALTTSRDDESLRDWLQDAFAVFGLASLAFNAALAISGKSHLNPPLDAIHMILALAINELWESLISPTGRSFLLTLAGVALLDACIGALFGILLFPIRRLALPRPVWLAVMLISFCGFELALLKWLAVRS